MYRTRHHRKNKTVLLFLLTFLFILTGSALLIQTIEIKGNASMDTSYFDNKEEISYSCDQTRYNNNINYYFFNCTIFNISNHDLSNWEVIIPNNDSITLINSSNAIIELENNNIKISNIEGTQLLISNNINITFLVSTTSSNIDFTNNTGNASDKLSNSLVSVSLKESSSWDKFYQYEAKITNNTGAAISNYELVLLLEEGTIGNNFWSTNYTLENNILIQSPLWINPINNGASTTFSFQLENENTNPNPIVLFVDGK